MNKLFVYNCWISIHAPLRQDGTKNDSPIFRRGSPRAAGMPGKAGQMCYRNINRKGILAFKAKDRISLSADTVSVLEKSFYRGFVLLSHTDSQSAQGEVSYSSRFHSPALLRCYSSAMSFKSKNSNRVCESLSSSFRGTNRFL